MKTKRIEVSAKTKSGRYITVMVPSIMQVCPCCEGQSDAYCGLCHGKNVIEVIDETALALYPKIAKAIERYDLEEQRDAWDAYGERMMGC